VHSRKIAEAIGGVAGGLQFVSALYALCIAIESNPGRRSKILAFLGAPFTYSVAHYIHWIARQVYREDTKDVLARSMAVYGRALSLLARAKEDSVLVVFQGHHERQGDIFQVFQPRSTPWSSLFESAGLRKVGE
jgi:hypothetical protein